MVIRCNRNLLVDLQVRDLLLSAPAVTEQDSCVLGTENAVRRTIHVSIRVKPKHRTVVQIFSRYILYRIVITTYQQTITDFISYSAEVLSRYSR